MPVLINKGQPPPSTYEGNGSQGKSVIQSAKTLRIHLEAAAKAAASIKPPNIGNGSPTYVSDQSGVLLSTKRLIEDEFSKLRASMSQGGGSGGGGSLDSDFKSLGL